MSQSKINQPYPGQLVEIWSHVLEEFQVQTIKTVLHQGMKGWTIETRVGILADVIPNESDSSSAAWREYRG